MSEKTNESLNFDETMDLANLVKSEIQKIEDELARAQNKESTDDFNKSIYSLEDDTKQKAKRLQEKIDLWQAVYGKLTSGFRRVHTKITLHLSDEVEPDKEIFSSVEKLKDMPKKVESLLEEKEEETPFLS